MNQKIFTIIYVILLTQFSACNKKQNEGRATNKDLPPDPSQANNLTAEIRRHELEFVGDFTKSLDSADKNEILSAFSEYSTKIDAGFHASAVLRSIIKNGTHEQRVLMDNFITALCKVAEGSETTEMYMAHAFLFGATQDAFRAIHASASESIPPSKNVLEWWNASKLRALLLAK